jgi:hypothetical protein
MGEQRYDVVEVQIAAPHVVLIIATDKERSEAEAIAQMAVMRRGVERSYFALHPAGKFSDGDTLLQGKDHPNV